MKAIVVILAAICGALLNRAGAWIVHHDHINYGLPVAVSTAAETAFALGPVLWVAGVVLASPLALGWVREVGAFWKLAAMEAFAYLPLLCGLGSVGVFGLLGFGATVFLWAVAFVLAVVSPTRLAQHPRLYCCGARRSQQLHLWLNKPGVRGDSGGESLGER